MSPRWNNIHTTTVLQRVVVPVQFVISCGDVQVVEWQEGLRWMHLNLEVVDSTLGSLGRVTYDGISVVSQHLDYCNFILAVSRIN